MVDEKACFLLIVNLKIQSHFFRMRDIQKSSGVEDTEFYFDPNLYPKPINKFVEFVLIVLSIGNREAIR